MAERFAWPFFQPTVVDLEDGEKRYLGEDYSFCWRCHQIGVTPKVDTSFRLYHIGDYALRDRGGQRPVPSVAGATSNTTSGLCTCPHKPGRKPIPPNLDGADMEQTGAGQSDCRTAFGDIVYHRGQAPTSWPGMVTGFQIREAVGVLDLW